MKFVRPLFRDLFAWAEQRHVALATFAEWKASCRARVRVRTRVCAGDGGTW